MLQGPETVGVQGVGFTASAATKKFFGAVGVDIKRNKSGAEFFGFSRLDVQQKLNAALHDEVESNEFLWHGNDKENSESYVNSGINKSNDTITWKGVAATGKAPEFPEETADAVRDLWHATVNGKKRVWQPGFRSQQLVQNTETGQKYDVLCLLL